MNVFLFASLMLSAHEGTFLCKLDVQCTWRYLCLQAWCSMHMKVHSVCKLDALCTRRCLSFASSMPNAHPWTRPFICKLDSQCTTMNVFCHLQAWCSMCIHEGNLSFVSSMCMWAVQVLLQQMRWKRDFHECVTAGAVASMFVAAICFQRWIDWVEDLLLWKVHRSLSHLLLLLQQCDQTPDSRRKSQWVCLSRTADS